MIHQISLEQLRQSIERLVQGRPEIQLVCLFGSRARNQVLKTSDYDIAVLLESTPDDLSRYKLDLVNDLILDLRTDAVDVVILNQAPPLLKMTVYRDAQILFAATSAAWPRFAVRTLQEYEDTKPLRATFNHYLIQRLRAKRHG
jgi:hypothetical protein